MADILDVSTTTKNVTLPNWAIEELTEMAASQNNKCKPYMELLLINVAKEHKASKEAK